jgi:hypothetical protein
LADYNLTPGKYPKEYTQYSNHGESLKSRKQIYFKTRNINWLIGKKFPSIYRKQITHLQSGNQTYMEPRNRTVGLRQQVQRSYHANPNPKFS